MLSMVCGVSEDFVKLIHVLLRNRSIPQSICSVNAMVMQVL